MLYKYHTRTRVYISLYGHDYNILFNNLYCFLASCKTVLRCLLLLNVTFREYRNNSITFDFKCFVFICFYHRFSFIVIVSIYQHRELRNAYHNLKITSFFCFRQFLSPS